MASDSSESPDKQGLLRRLWTQLKKRKGAQPAESSLLDISSCMTLESSKQKMIKGIMELSSKIVREIMIPRVDAMAVSSGTPLKELVKNIEDAGHSRIPVYNTTIDDIAGVLYVKQLLPFIVRKPRKFELKKLLHKPYFVPETMTLDDLLLEFKRRKLHLACVVDEYGGFSGIVTLEDILEQIVGEIMDEFDEDEAPGIRKIGRNVYDVHSHTTLSDFNSETGAVLPSDQFDTIGGFVFDLFGKIPKKNETVRWNNLSFKIKDIKGTRISRIIVSISSA